ncbi:MAG: OmpA family protein [Flavobacteriales bacterium]|nr:OmpA family protein [Flavobacteriales bacterium]
MRRFQNMLIKISRYFLLTILALIIGSTAFAQRDKWDKSDRYIVRQEKKTKRSFESHKRRARNNLSKRNWKRAIFHYEAINNIDTSNAFYSYELGLAYFHSNLRKADCIEPFKRAIRTQNDTLGTPYYYLGNMYQLMGEYELAIENYKAFKKMMENGFFRYYQLMEVLGDWAVKESIPIYIKMMDREIRKCVFAMANQKPHDKHWRAVNLGDKVNSIYPDYAAVFSPDETKLIYTSRRKGGKGRRTYHDEIPYEDIYVSNIIDSVTWSDPVNLTESYMFKGTKVNTRKNESMIGFSSGGEKAYIMRKNDIMYTELKDTVWSKPQKIKDGDINTKAFEPSMFLYPDGAIFYFSSDRKGGYGGLDIYRSYKMPAGTWSIPVNLGPTINTRFDEDSPYFSQEGNTLYFASRGHENMGDFDIFKATEINKEWSKPENLGVPFNSPASDIFYHTDREEIYSYFSSSRLEGHGGMDIYSVMLKYPRANSDIRIVATGNLGLDISELQIVYLNLDTIEQPILASLKNGEAITNLHTKTHYKMIVKNGQYVAQSQIFYVPPQYSVHENYQEINLVYTPMKEYEGATKQLANFRNAFMNLKDSVAKNGGETLPQNLSASYRDFATNLRPVNNNTFQESTHLAYHGLENTSEKTTNIDERDLAEAKDPTLKVARLEQQLKDSLANAAALANPNLVVIEFSPPIVYFNYNSFYLDTSDKALLMTFKTFLLDNNEVKIEVTGSTDSKGELDYNIQLSKKRAQATIAFLITKGISPSRFTWVYKGEENPYSSNDSESGRSQNRSVRFKLNQ